MSACARRAPLRPRCSDEVDSVHVTDTVPPFLPENEVGHHLSCKTPKTKTTTMHPENIPLIIMLVSGVMLGCLIGFLTAASFTQRQLMRRERETWRAASNYFSGRDSVRSRD